MCDKHHITEEPCNGKLLSTVLESSGSRERVADFNHLTSDRSFSEDGIVRLAGFIMTVMAMQHRTSGQKVSGYYLWAEGTPSLLMETA
jgi:hypothetical protein